MNDRFMHILQKPPRREFSEKLYQSLNQDQSRIPAFAKERSPLPRLALASAAICLALVLALVVSPTARARMIDIVQKIGGINITQTAEYPGSGGDENILPSQELSLDEARQALPYPVRLPVWTPPGFVFHPEAATLTEFPNNDTPLLRVYWVKEYPDSVEVQTAEGASHIQTVILDLTIAYPASKSVMGAFIVGMDSVEEVLVNGQPAALVRGAWNADTHTWGAGDLLFLHWQQDDVVYTLSATEFGVSVEEMIQIAESLE